VIIRIFDEKDVGGQTENVDFFDRARILHFLQKAEEYVFE
jgi:hypothetical protein